MTADRMHNETSPVRDEILSLLPALRAFAFILTRRRVDADRLVQETLVRAIHSIHGYTAEKKLKSWLFTIMRSAHRAALTEKNSKYSNCYEKGLINRQAQTRQYGEAEINDLYWHLARLPREQQEVLALISGLGFSYEDASQALGCSVGTVKSRLSRGRAQLSALMEGQSGQ